MFLMVPFWTLIPKSFKYFNQNINSSMIKVVKNIMEHVPRHAYCFTGVNSSPLFQNIKYSLSFIFWILVVKFNKDQLINFSSYCTKNQVSMDNKDTDDVNNSAIPFYKHTFFVVL